MINRTERRARINAINADLMVKHPDGYCVVMSLANSQFQTVGGQLIEVNNDDAAVCLYQQTHRLATDSEVAQFRAEQEEARRAMAAVAPAKTAIYFAQQRTEGSKKK